MNETQQQKPPATRPSNASLPPAAVHNKGHAHMPRAPKKEERPHAYGAGPFVKITTHLLDSDAFIGLSVSAKCVLIDWITTWNFAVHKDELVEDRYLKFSYGQSRTPVTENTFYRAMEQLRKHGFIARANSKSRSRGQANLWRALDSWQRFPTSSFPAAAERVREVRQRQGLYKLYEQQQQLLLNIDIAPAPPTNLEELGVADPAEVAAVLRAAVLGVKNVDDDTRRRRGGRGGAA